MHGNPDSRLEIGIRLQIFIKKDVIRENYDNSGVFRNHFVDILSVDFQYAPA